MGHSRVKFRIGRSHYNAALVRIRIRIDDNFYTPGGDQFEFEFEFEFDSTTAILEFDSFYSSTGLNSNCSNSSSRSSSSSVPSIYPFRVEFINKHNCFSSSSSSSGAHYDGLQTESKLY